jgi:hypothetical protein
LILLVKLLFIYDELVTSYSTRTTDDMTLCDLIQMKVWKLVSRVKRMCVSLPLTQVNSHSLHSANI